MGTIHCSVTIDSHQRELASHGSVAFPIACYNDDLSQNRVPWHWHDEMEFAIMQSGVAEWALENTRIELRAGDGIFINAGALHAVSDETGQGATLHSAVFHPRLVGGSMDSVFWQRLIQPFLKAPALRCIVLHQDVARERAVLDCFADAWHALAQEPEDFENQVRYHLSRALRLLAIYLPPPASAPGEQECLDASRIRAMLAYIDAHFSEDLTLDTIAGSANISSSAALRCFNATLGTSPIQYLRQLRLEKAAELLRTTALTSKAVAGECGFNDFSYFTKIFRERTGQTPRAYRLTHQPSSR